MKKIILAGGSGFLGQILTKHFNQQGYSVIILSRSPKSANQIYWDGKTLGKWCDTLEGCDVLINLTGRSVDCRYTDKNKAEILHSRIDSTKILQTAIEQSKNPPKLWLNASSATIYMHAERVRMTEANGLIGDDFSMGVCKQWEATFFERPLAGTRKIALRSSIVLGNQGGAYPKLKMISRLGLGGKQGRGHQFMSWIHAQDFCEAISLLIDKKEIEGPVNITSPNPIRNDLFMQKLRQQLRIPFGIPQPLPVLELGAWMMGTETELLLKSRNVYPERLLQEGFEFGFPKIEATLSDLG